MSLQNKAEQYFGKLNSMAKRLYEDINETKAAYDTLWTKLSQDEKEEIINESIIKPEASLQYKLVENVTQDNSKYAVKTIVDDNYTYRDEHSAPFSFRTPSQRDLRIFGICQEAPNINDTCISNTNDTYVNNTSDTYIINNTNDTFNHKKSENFEACDINELSNHINHDLSSSNNNSLTNIPKTGLDLLDNW